MPQEITEEKVQAIAQYINEILKEKNVIIDDQTVGFAEEINQQRDLILRKKKYDFMQLESVRSLCKKTDNFSELTLNMQNEFIEYKAATLDSKIIYATEEYLMKKYEEYTLKMQELREYASRKNITLKTDIENQIIAEEKIEEKNSVLKELEKQLTELKMEETKIKREWEELQKKNSEGE